MAGQELSDREHEIVKNIAARRLAFSEEVRDIPDEVRKDSMRLILENMDTLNKMDFSLSETQEWYSKNCTSFYCACRKLIRMANLEYNQYDDEYSDLLYDVATAFEKNPRDYGWALAIHMENERLFTRAKQQKRSEECLYRFENKAVGYMNALWPAIFLFGREKSASYLLQCIGLEHFHDKNFVDSHLYLQRASDWYRPGYYDLDTSQQLLVTRLYRDEVRDSLKQRKQLYKSQIYSYDRSMQAKELRHRILPAMLHPFSADIESAIFFREIGLDYWTDKKYAMARYYLQRSVSCYENNGRLKSSDKKDYKNTLYYLAKSYEILGNAGKCRELLKDCVSERDDSLKTFTGMLARMDLALLDKKEHLWLEALSSFKKLGEDLQSTSFFMDFLPDIGFVYTDKSQTSEVLYVYYLQTQCERDEINGNYAESLSSRVKIKEGLECANMASSTLYLDNLIVMAENYLRCNMADSAIIVIDQINKLGGMINRSGIEKATVDLLMAQACHRVGDSDKKLLFLEKAYDEIKEDVSMSIFSMLDRERIHFMEKVQTLLNSVIHECIDQSSGNEKFAGCALNCSLLIKGLQLHSSNEIRNAIINNGNQEVQDTYAKMVSLKSCLMTFDEPEVTYRDGENIDLYINRMLESVLQKEQNLKKADVDYYEHLLLSEPTMVENINQMRNRLNVDWNVLQSRMSKSDLFIEFSLCEESTGFSVINSDSVYVAFILEKEGVPKAVRLLKQSELKKIVQKDVYQKELSALIWDPLKTYIESKDSVYFTASYSLHNIGIEYLPDENGIPLFWKKPIYRLTSFRNFDSYNHVTAGIKKAALFGAPLFRKDPQKSDFSIVGRQAIIPGLIEPYMKIGLPLLPSSIPEVLEISNILNRSGINVDLYMGGMATEDKLKNISGDSIHLLHLSTHGLFSSKPISNMSSLKYKEDAMLNQSCLFFTGALDFIDENINQEEKYGILTGREISCLNLSSVRLLVLAACVSGRGFITGEGVYGLQRGFKKAGVGCMLVTLQNIDDFNTCLLMIHFYRNLLSNMPPREALVKSQKELFYSKEVDSLDFFEKFILVDDI